MQGSAAAACDSKWRVSLREGGKATTTLSFSYDLRSTPLTQTDKIE